MEASYWQQRWEINQIGFHGDEVNPLLVSHIGALGLDKGARLFLPLCGKTLDIAWLLSQGFRVVGAELSAIAVRQLFSDLGVVPVVTNVDKIDHYSANNIDIYVGDIFHLTSQLLGPVDAVYDRAALVALPAEMRERYTTQLMAVTHAAPQLLICYEYEQSLMEGPPFSVSDEEAKRHYQAHYAMMLLASADLPKGMKGKCAAIEKVWLLQHS